MDNNKAPKWLIVVAGVLFAGFTLTFFLVSDNWKFGFISLISGLFGFILKYGPFGFTCSFRAIVTKADFSQMRDMLIFLFVGTLFCSIIELFSGLYPLFQLPAKKRYQDSASSVGISLVLGSFLFGMGMILGSGCASGTFVGMGGGFIKSYVVLLFFIIGATIFALNPFYNFWSKLPKTSASVQIHFSITLVILIALYGITLVIDYFKAKNQYQKGPKKEEIDQVNTLIPSENEKMVNDDKKNNTKVEGIKIKWYSSIRAVIVSSSLGLVISIFYLCTGKMIGVMGVFPIIGANILKLFGARPENWDYFKGGIPSNVLSLEIFDSDIFMALGAFIASSIKGNFGTDQCKGIGEYIKGIIGGLLMGIGARMAGGCNIGAMTSGITSSSIHGFIWMICAILGCFCSCKIVSFIENKMKPKNTINETKEEENSKNK